jgi:hypothetical protein
MLYSIPFLQVIDLHMTQNKSPDTIATFEPDSTLTAPLELEPILDAIPKQEEHICRIYVGYEMGHLDIAPFGVHIKQSIRNDLQDDLRPPQATNTSSSLAEALSQCRNYSPGITWYGLPVNSFDPFQGQRQRIIRWKANMQFLKSQDDQVICRLYFKLFCRQDNGLIVS